MTKILIAFLLTVSTSLCLLHAQCDDTFAGTMLQGGSTICLDDPGDIPTVYQYFEINNFWENDPLLDANDTLLFYMTDDNGPVNGQVFGISGGTSDMQLLPGMQPDVSYRLYAVAGNNDGAGGIDFSDPCLDVSGFWGLFYTLSAPDVIDGFFTATLSCDDTSVILDASALVSDPSSPNFTYLWSTGETTPTITVNMVGDYFVDISQEGYFCPKNSTFTVSAFTPNLEINFAPVDSISCEMDSVLIQAIPDFPLDTWSSIWLDLNGNVVATDVLEFYVYQPGIYTIQITLLSGPASGCLQIDAVTVPASNEGCTTIRGTVVRDENNNCLYDPNESGLANRLILFSGTAIRYALTDINGNYEVKYPANSAVDIEIVSQHFLYENCSAGTGIPTGDIGTSQEYNIAQSTLDDCPLLQVQLHAGITRRCFSVPFTLSYCNLGNLPADNAYIIVTLDSNFSIDSSEVAFTDLGNNEYKFDLGTVAEDDCGSFKIFTTLSCDAMNGETLCSEAHIFPNNPCPDPNGNWSGASLSVTGECTGSENIFTIENVGTQDMSQMSNYVVIEDGVMVFQAPAFSLASGESFQIVYPADGGTYRVAVMQVPDHPGSSMPSFTLEGCGGFGSMGFVNQFPQNELDPFVDIECRIVVGSFDPNDKTAFPSGYGDENYIYADQQIEYLIRFQNTGTDTAFTVIIEDVIDTNLDLNTLRPIGASHDYEIQILENDTVQFIFNNILLPDSSANLIGSNGYVRFSISPESDVALGTVIKNKAGIYFDFNPAIVTNEVFHTIEEDFIIISDLTTPIPINLEVRNFPNPTSDNWYLQVSGIDDFLKNDNNGKNAEVNLRLTNTQGQIILEELLTRDGLELNVSHLPPGVYFWQLENEGSIWSSGKLIRL